jgi:hypothetical protein
MALPARAWTFEDMYHLVGSFSAEIDYWLTTGDAKNDYSARMGLTNEPIEIASSKRASHARY